MAYSFTEKKRIRKNFGKRPTILDVPYLLSIQVDSYTRSSCKRTKPSKTAMTSVNLSGSGASAGGMGFDVPLELPFSPVGQTIGSGTVYYFQVWYRDEFSVYDGFSKKQNTAAPSGNGDSNIEP